MTKEQKYQRDWYREHREAHLQRTKISNKKRRALPAEKKRLRKYNLKRYWADVEKSREKSRKSIAEWRKNNPKRWADIIRRCLYGIEPEEVVQLLNSQKGKCPICLRQLGQKFSVDHNHESGEVRGLLCRNCNAGIGLLQDCFQNCFRAFQYLKGVI